jgi:hypothetical protein
MTRLLAVLLIFSLALPTASAAPALKGKDLYYYPTKEGDKWVYESRSGDTATEYTETVTKVEAKDGAFIVSVGREYKTDVKSFSRMQVSDKGLVRIGTGDRDLPVPVPMLKLAAKPGDTWSYEPAVPEGVAKRTVTYTMGKEEEIEVPAGKFKALRVEMSQTIPGAVVESVPRTTYWYAPGVGLVKSATNAGGKERTVMLKSFTPGK